MKFSVLMSVYGGERPEFLRQSLQSLAVQTVPASEIVIVRDGALGGELKSALTSYSSVLPIASVELKERAGLGPALSAGLASCSNEVVARMDSDDICLPFRFETQLAFLEQNPRVAAVGTAIGEFIDDPNRVVAIRRLPRSGRRLKKFAKFRNPLNHMTVMFRKSAVLAAGGYRHFPGLEDYDLWVRMLAQGMEIDNIPEILVLARCGPGMARRRGGVRYVQNEVRLYRQFLDLGFISVPEFAMSLLVRIPVRVLPGQLRPALYRTLLRQKGNSL